MAADPREMFPHRPVSPRKGLAVIAALTVVCWAVVIGVSFLLHMVVPFGWPGVALAWLIAIALIGWAA